MLHSFLQVVSCLQRDGDVHRMRDIEAGGRGGASRVGGDLGISLSLNRTPKRIMQSCSHRVTGRRGYKDKDKAGCSCKSPWPMEHRPCPGA